MVLLLLLGYTGVILFDVDESKQTTGGLSQKWWRKDSDENTGRECNPLLTEGQPCPSCIIGQLRYNGLFQLICDTCDRVAEQAVFT